MKILTIHLQLNWLTLSICGISCSAKKTKKTKKTTGISHDIQIVTYCVFVRLQINSADFYLIMNLLKQHKYVFFA